MVELVLRDAGWRAISLGEDLPISSMAMAIERHKPSIVWLSCSYLKDVDRFVEQYNQLYDTFHNRAKFALGGQALTPEIQARVKFDLMGTKMQDVYEFASQAALRRPN
jgi:MerR family transcriptional regulator, light-induced transcriptional regulator